MAERKSEIRTNTRRGRQYEQVYIPEDTSAEEAASVYANFHGGDVERIAKVVDEVKEFMQEGPYFTAFDGGEVRERRSYGSIFKNRFRNAGIPDEHAKRVMHRAASDLAANVQEETLSDKPDMDYLSRRYGLIVRLDEKTK